MSDRSFLDTNVLVYAVETGGPDPDKSAAARALTRRAGATLSTQVLGEFYRAVTSPRRASPMTHDEAVAWIQLWKRHEVRPLTVPHVDLALEFAGPFQINDYDALLLAAARLAGCETLYSEDLNAGQDYDGVLVLSSRPFRPQAGSARAGRWHRTPASMTGFAIRVPSQYRFSHEPARQAHLDQRLASRVAPLLRRGACA